MYYSALLKLCGWEEEQISRERPRLDQAFVLFILGIAATEVSVGLALVLHAYRRSGSVDPETYNVLKG